MAAKKTKATRVIPGFGLTLGITIAMLSVLVLIPLASVLIYSFRLSPAEFFHLVTTRIVKNALITSIVCSAIAAVINCIFGVILAWCWSAMNFRENDFLTG